MPTLITFAYSKRNNLRLLLPSGLTFAAIAPLALSGATAIALEQQAPLQLYLPFVFIIDGHDSQQLHPSTPKSEHNEMWRGYVVVGILLRALVWPDQGVGNPGLESAVPSRA